MSKYAPARTRQVSMYKASRSGRRRPEDTVVDLLIEIIQPTVPLPGAACVGRPELFDIEAPKDVQAQAAQICSTECPVAQRCTEWVQNRPPKIVSGVVGGALHRGPYPRSTRTRRTPLP